MKILVIGDVHGDDFWKRHIEKNIDNVDSVVFIGDYFDSLSISDHSVIFQNFNDILNFKKTCEKPVVTIIGNHDFHYSKFCNGRYSGYNEKSFIIANDMINDMIESGELCLVYIVDNYIFSHAGVSALWFLDFVSDKTESIHELNSVFINSPRIANFVDDSRTKSIYGDDPCQTPIWIRPSSLTKNPYGDFHQVVGHTSVDFSKLFVNHIEMRNGKNLYLTDSSQKEAFIIDTETAKCDILR